MNVLVIDNYDSFVYNLVQYLGEQGAKPVVYRNDELSYREAEKLKPDRVVISPGPGSPELERCFGVCSKVIKEMGMKTPILGVCLGHQGIYYNFGGKIRRAKNQVHGKTSIIEHDGKGIFKNIPNPFKATRYHSLVAESKSLPDCLELTARSIDDGEVMAIRHKDYPIIGIQFHPESILTDHGKQIIRNFLDIEGFP
jgi:anthranilate synthase/aminodeoxychorismate synthase-like glutamine amidotransferase